MVPPVISCRTTSRAQAQDRDLDHLAQELGHVDQHGVSDGTAA